MKMRCVRPCWDSRIPKYYWQGEEADIDPKDPIAHHFELLDGTPVPKAEFASAVVERPDEVPIGEYEELKPPEIKGRVGKGPIRKHRK